MRDNSGAEPRLVRYRSPRVGRPSRVKPTFPFVVEEWGKARVSIVPAGWRPKTDGSNLPKTYRRGRPGPGTLALYFGEKNVAERLKRGPILYQGFAYNEKDANERLRSYLKRRFGSGMRQVRVRLKKMGLPPDADVQTLYNALASRAKSGLSGDKRGKRRSQARSYPTTGADLARDNAHSAERGAEASVRV